MRHDTPSTHTHTLPLFTVGYQLFSLRPDPQNFAQRELFRLWLMVKDPVDLNERTRPLFPALLTQNAILVWQEQGENRSKVVCKEVGFMEPDVFFCVVKRLTFLNARPKRGLVV